MTDPASPGSCLRIEQLTVALADGSELLRQASLQVNEGEFVLIVGRSGSGKSTLLRLIAGLDDPDSEDVRFTGRVSVLGHEWPRLSPGSVGLVFQTHALFDELSAVENVRFAQDHRMSRESGGRVEPQALLERLGVPHRESLSALSGGERQRVAVARTLAMDAPLLLFDEPTAGLDPARARDVAALIHDTYRQFGKTVIVVTHDMAPFLSFQPRLILLDDLNGTLVDMDESDVAHHYRQVGPVSRGNATPGAAPKRWTRRVVDWLEWPGRALWTFGHAFAAPLGGWHHPRWKLRYLAHYLRMTAIGTPTIYVAIAGAMLGFVFITFSFSNIPYSNVTVPILTEEFLAATGYSMFRVVVPLMISVLMAGKCGAAAAADLGARRLTQQFEAMRNLGAAPSHYLFGNLALALVIGGPLLTLVGFLVSCYASLVAFLMSSPQTTVAVFRRNFFATMWPADFLLPKGTGWVILKATTTGVLIAALAYLIGSRPKASSVDVSRDVSLTIFWASLGVLMLHALYSFVEF